MKRKRRINKLQTRWRFLDLHADQFHFQEEDTQIRRFYSKIQKERSSNQNSKENIRALDHWTKLVILVNQGSFWQVKKELYGKAKNEGKKACFTIIDYLSRHLFYLSSLFTVVFSGHFYDVWRVAIRLNNNF